MIFIWKKKLFWQEETDNNRLYIHPLLVFGILAAVLVIAILIV